MQHWLIPSSHSLLSVIAESFGLILRLYYDTIKIGNQLPVFTVYFEEVIFLDKNLRNFANGLKRARKKAGYRSQKRFVEALNEAYKAEGFSVTVDTVENWEQGKSSPAMNVFLKLCDFFDCSADYLLYKIDEKNHDLQFICEYTGLSENAVEKLHSVYFDKQSKAFINRLIAEYGENFHDLYSYIAGAIDSQKLTSEEDVNVSLATHVKAGGVNPKYYDSVPSGAEILPADKACDFKLSEASRVFRELIKDYVESSIQEK